jgi:hypothetical protein
MDAKCNCNHCNQPISFPVEGVGQTIACPHCGIETILFIPPEPPKPKPPKNFIPATKLNDQIRKQKFYIRSPILTFLTFLNLLVALAIGVFIFLIWQKQQQPPVPVRWDVSSFEFSAPFPHDEFSSQKYKMMLRFGDLHGLDAASATTTTPEQEISADGILDRIGNDGWELAWTDGKTYIVKRPQGQWYHDYFEVFEQAETNRSAMEQ